MSKFYVYTLAYPPEMGGAVFYVGKGQGNRIDNHERDAGYGVQDERCNVIRSIQAAGFGVVKTKTLENISDDEARTEERRLIAEYGRENLTNRSGGGERGQVPSPYEMGRINVQLEVETLAKLDRMCKKIGFSRSTMVGLIIRATNEDLDWLRRIVLG